MFFHLGKLSGCEMFSFGKNIELVTLFLICGCWLKSPISSLKEKPRKIDSGKMSQIRAKKGGKSSNDYEINSVVLDRYRYSFQIVYALVGC